MSGRRAAGLAAWLSAFTGSILGILYGILPDLRHTATLIVAAVLVGIGLGVTAAIITTDNEL